MNHYEREKNDDEDYRLHYAEPSEQIVIFQNEQHYTYYRNGQQKKNGEDVCPQYAHSQQGLPVALLLH